MNEPNPQDILDKLSKQGRVGKKLSEREVQIVRWLSDHGVSPTDIAKGMHVSRYAVSLILHRHTYKNLEYKNPFEEI